jgi:hypothetical protein
MVDRPICCVGRPASIDRDISREGFCDNNPLVSCWLGLVLSHDAVCRYSSVMTLKVSFGCPSFNSDGLI